MVRASFVRVAVTLIGMATGFVALPYIVTGLGPGWYGVWVTISSIVAAITCLISVCRQASCVTSHRRWVEATSRRRTSSLARPLSCIRLWRAYTLLITAVLVAFVPLIVAIPGCVVVRAAVAVSGVNLALTFPSKAFRALFKQRSDTTCWHLSPLPAVVIGAVASVVIVSKGGGILGLAVISLVVSQLHNLAYVAISRHLLPSLRVHRSYLRRELFQSLLRYSSWASS